MYIDFKISTWERVNVDDSIKEDVIAKLKSGEISSSNDLFDLYSDYLFNFDPNMIETSEQLTPEDNNGMSTIEAYEDDHSDIWTNKS